ncbi:unnamed protein product [Schistosoma turkestanicum]|nr:unnamed protein product [Schistosoma turkestanicum]
MNDLSVELWTLLNQNISTMITWEFREVFEPNQRNDHCNGTSCMFIALLLAVIIIFIKHFHSTSTRNTIFIIVTLIIMTIGVGLLSPPGNWKDYVIAPSLTYTITIPAVFLGVQLKLIPRLWRILLFSFCCILATAGIAFFISSIVKCCSIPLAVLSLICWCGSMFLVILLTTYYMKKYCESEDYSSLYMTLISAFEFVILLIISEIHVNYFAHCCQNSTVTQQNRF